jgi:general secretion pathway protein H
MRYFRLNDGFTLVEILVVLGILSLTLVLVVPFSRSSGEARELDSFVRALASELRSAQQSAIMTNDAAAVTFDLDRRTFQLNFGKHQTIPQNLHLSLLTATGELQGNKARYRFFADGGSTGGRIKATADRFRKTINIDWLTGRVTVTEEEKP